VHRSGSRVRASSTVEELRLCLGLAQTSRRPAPWVAAAALNGMAIGLLWLMVSKPGWTQSLEVVTALGLAGAIVGSAAVRRGTGTLDPRARPD
jgi:hypothetical protein